MNIFAGLNDLEIIAYCSLILTILCAYLLIYKAILAFVNSLKAENLIILILLGLSTYWFFDKLDSYNSLQPTSLRTLAHEGYNLGSYLGHSVREVMYASQHAVRELAYSTQHLMSELAYQLGLY